MLVRKISLILFIFLLLILVLFMLNEILWGTNLILVGLLILFSCLIGYFILENFSKSKIDQTTIYPLHNKETYHSQLILKNHKISLKDDYSKIFGRGEFLEIVSFNDLRYIGKDHFKIVKNDDGFYINDLNTKNGTLLNRYQIKGKGEIKLKNNDEIVVAKTIEMRYLEKEI